MKNIFKIQILMLLLPIVSVKKITVSDSDEVYTPRSREESTPRGQRRSAIQYGQLDQEFQDQLDSSQFGLSNPSSAASAFSPSVGRSSTEESSFRVTRSCTPPLSNPLEFELQHVIDEACQENRQIVAAIREQLMVLREERDVAVDVWRGIFRNLKEIKDSPQKPDLRQRTIVSVGRIVAKEAFDILQETYRLPQDRIGALFRAERRDHEILRIVEDASTAFNDQADISALPAWIVKKCFEKVDNDCKSPEKHAGLRAEIPGLPLVRAMHIAHGHALQTRENDVAEKKPVLRDPKHGGVSLVWKELQKIEDDGSPKRRKDGEVDSDFDIRKTLFPLGMSKDDVEACVLRTVQTPKIGVVSCGSCNLSLYKDPQSELFIQLIDSAGGALVGTAYPIRIITKDECKKCKNSFIDIMQQMPNVQALKGTVVRLMVNEALSSVEISDRIIADCGDKIVVEIGHIDPLCSQLLNVGSQQAAPVAKPSPAKGKRGKQEEDFSATTCAVNTKISQYCPIGIEVSLIELQKMNKNLHSKVMEGRLKRAEKAVA